MQKFQQPFDHEGKNLNEIRKKRVSFFVPWQSTKKGKIVMAARTMSSEIRSSLSPHVFSLKTFFITVKSPYGAMMFNSPTLHTSSQEEKGRKLGSSIIYGNFHHSLAVVEEKRLKTFRLFLTPSSQT